MRPSLAKYKLYAPLTSVDGSRHCSFSSSPFSFPPTGTTTHLPQTISVFPPEGFCLPPVESPEIPLISTPPFSPSSKLWRKRNHNRFSAAKYRTENKAKKRILGFKLKEVENINVTLKDRLWALEAEIKCLQKLRYEMTAS